MNKIRLEKARAMSKWKTRSDYDGTLMVVDHLAPKEQIKKEASESSEVTYDDDAGTNDLV